MSSIFKTKESKILDDLTFFSNIAIIRSKADLSNLIKNPSSSTISTTIPLQGQSPYVLNVGIQYINKDNGWSTSANLNRIGDRVAYHGNLRDGSLSPALWEKSRTFLDMQIAKSFLKNKLEVKLNIQNVLAQDLIFYQNNDAASKSKSGFTALVNNIFTGDSQNKNGFDSKTDDLVWQTKFGRTFSFSMSYTF